MILNGDAKEFDGSGVEEAISKAEKSFGVSRENLEIKVVCEEKRGLFGMCGGKKAKIKAVPRKT